MDIAALFSDSFAYAREALVGRWARWMIFIILALPFSLIRFVFDMTTITRGTSVNWGAIPWGRIAILAGIGILLSFFISGYMVRIYRGAKPAPDFNGWGGLFVDGIKLAIVWLLWLLPVFIVLVAGAAFAFVIFVSSPAAPAPNIAILLFVLLLVLLEFFLVLIVLLFGILGAVRFARTGSIREGIRFSGILATIRTMGWLSYILALIVVAVAGIVYAVITAALSVIPLIGWILVLIIGPFFTIFTARYFTLVYDQGEPSVIPQAPIE
jgi:hypothetical protein